MNQRNMKTYWYYIQGKGSQLFQYGSAAVSRKVKDIGTGVDNFFGVTEVKTAQETVRKAEEGFLLARQQTQDAKLNLDERQQSLKEMRKKLDRCQRDDEHYLQYVTEEHQLLMDEKKFKRLYEQLEEAERVNFSNYSAAVRVSHEKERARAERTKYWSLIGSVSGTVIGFIGSSLITYYRIKQIRELTSSNGVVKVAEDLQKEIRSQNVHTTSLQNQFKENADNLLAELKVQCKMMNQRVQSMTNIPNADGKLYTELRPKLENLEKNILTKIDNFTEKTLKENRSLKEIKSSLNADVSEIKSGQLQIKEELASLNRNMGLTSDQGLLENGGFIVTTSWWEKAISLASLGILMYLAVKS